MFRRNIPQPFVEPLPFLINVKNSTPNEYLKYIFIKYQQKNILKYEIYNF